MASEQEVASLVIRLRADVSDLKTSFEAGRREVQSFAATNTSVLGGLKAGWLGLAAAVMTVYEAFKKLGDVVDVTMKLNTETYRLMKSTGMTAEEASGLIAVANDLGIEFQAVAGAALSIARKMGGLKDIESGVVDETGKSIDVFEKWGIQVKNTDGTIRSFSDVFDQIRTRIRAASTETERLAIATQFFMRGSAQQLLPLLTLTDEQYKEMLEDQKRFGVVLTKDNVVAARAFFFAMHNMEDAIMGLKLAIGNEIIPVLTEYTKTLAENIKGMKDWTKEHKWIITFPFKALEQMVDDFKALAIAIAVIVVVGFGAEIISWIYGLTAVGGLLAVAAANANVLLAALVAFGLVKFSEYLDTLMRKWSGLTEAERKEAEQNKINEERLKAIAAAHPEKQFDFTPPNPAHVKALDELKKKTQELNVAYLETVDPLKASRQALEDWIMEVLKTAGITDVTKAPDAMVAAIQKLLEQFEKTSAAKNYNDIMEQLKSQAAQLGIEFVRLTDPLKASRLEFEESIRKMTLHKQVTGEIQKKINELRGAFERLKDAEAALAKTEAEEKAKQSDIGVKYEKENLLLQNQYDEGLISLGDYYAKRKAIIESQTNDEIALLDAQIERAKTADPAKVIELEAEKRAKLAKVQTENIKLTKEETEEQKKLAELRIALQKSAVEMAYARKEIDVETYLQKQIDLNKQLLAIEIERLKKQVPNSEAYMETMQKINDILAQQVDLQNRLEEKTGTFWEGLKRGYKEWSDSVKSKFEIARDTFKEVMTAMRDTFKDFFLDAMEGKLKSFSDYWKSFTQKLREIWANALADMVQDWIKNFIKKLMSQGLSSIFSSVGSLFGLGGGSQVPLSGEFGPGGLAGAEGGAIRGGSGVRDDVRLLAMGGEFLHPVQAVKYYGEGIMEAIRLRRIPRNLLSQFSAGFAPRPSYAFAGGGMVSTQPAGNSLAINVPVNIENPRLASMLRSNIEDVVRRTLRGFM